MVTVTDRETQRSQGTGGRYCEGCPRCTDEGAGFCKQSHPQHNNLHPVCRKCGHCVLRGNHSDDTSDLQQSCWIGPSTFCDVVTELCIPASPTTWITGLRSTSQGMAQNTREAEDHFNSYIEKYVTAEDLRHDARAKSNPSTGRESFCSQTPSLQVDVELPSYLFGNSLYQLISLFTIQLTQG